MIGILEAISSLAANYFPLVSSTAVVLLLALWLHRSIKKHAQVYYWVFGGTMLFTLANVILGALEAPSVPIRETPVLREVFTLFTNIGGLSFPLLLIIMYVGALDTKHRMVAKLMSIRKELSIISGFTVLTHATLRIIFVIPGTFKFFFGAESEGEMHGETLGYVVQLLMHSAFFLGLFMTALFLVLWITSFTKVRRSLGSKRWKAVQRWSYLLYGMLFCHSMLLNTGKFMGSLSNEKPVERYVIALASTLLIFGSYLVLRLRKAQRDKTKKKLRQSDLQSVTCS